jgi:hypothetical protein
MRGGPLLRGLAIALAGLLVAGLTAWAAGAIYLFDVQYRLASDKERGPPIAAPPSCVSQHSPRVLPSVPRAPLPG